MFLFKILLLFFLVVIACAIKGEPVPQGTLISITLLIVLDTLIEQLGKSD